MSDRLIALADAADAVCAQCDAPRRYEAYATVFWSNGWWWSGWKHSYGRFLGFGVAIYCDANMIRKIVEREHPGLGSKPTSEWRR